MLLGRRFAEPHAAAILDGVPLVQFQALIAEALKNLLFALTVMQGAASNRATRGGEARWREVLLNRQSLEPRTVIIVVAWPWSSI